MDAHRDDVSGADDVRALDESDAAAALADFLEAEEGDEAPEADEPEADPEEAEEQEDEQDSDEPDEPAIEAPASLTADEKAKFAQLPDEAQRLIAEVETRRNTQVQQATTRAAEAQREAKAAAAEADARAKLTYAQQLDEFVRHYAPQPPDPALARVDPAAYIAQEAQYRAIAAQHDTIVQQVKALEADAAKHLDAQEQAWQAAQVQELMKVPEFANPETRATFLESLQSVGAELGYSPELMASAGANDILALKQAAEWKAGHDKWKAAESRKMQRVRDAKSAKPNPAQPVGSGKVRQFNQTRQQLRSSGSIDDAARAIAALRG